MKIVIGWLFLLLSANAFCSGKIVYTKGRTYLNGKSVKKGVNFKKGAVFKTGANSILVARIDGGSTIKLSEASELKLVSKERQSEVVKFNFGQAFFNIKKSMNGKKKFKVLTRSASMGIRGTEFFVAYGSDKDEWMCVNKGAVVVKARGEKKKTLVKAGEGIVIKGGKRTSDPTPLEWTKKLNWKMDPKKGSLKNE